MLFKKLKRAGVIAVLLSTVSLLRAQELALSDQWTTLVKQIQTKLDAGKTNESDFSGELAAFDKLIASQDKSHTNEIADLMFKEAELYYVEFNDLDKGAELYRKISVEYPGYKLASAATHNADVLHQLVVAKRIHDKLTPGTVFPDFAEHDLNGKSLSVSNYAGKVVLVDFWATWCPNCSIELPWIEKLYQAKHDKGFEIIGVNLNKADERNEFDAYLKKNSDMKWQQYYEGMYFSNKLALKYGIQVAPSNILVGRDGKIIATDLHGPDLEAAVGEALDKKPAKI